MRNRKLCLAVAVLCCSLPWSPSDAVPRNRRRPTLRPEDAQGAQTEAASEEDEFVNEEVGGLTVQEPPKGWPLSDLQAYEKQHPGKAAKGWFNDPVVSGSKPQPEWFTAADAEGVPDQQQEASRQAAAWVVRGRQGRLLAQNPGQDIQGQPATQQQPAYFTASESRPSQTVAEPGQATGAWTTSSPRFKKKRSKSLRQSQQQQQQQQEQDVQQHEQQYQQLQQQHHQLQQDQLLQQQQDQLLQQQQEQLLQQQQDQLLQQQQQQQLDQLQQQQGQFEQQDQMQQQDGGHQLQHHESTTVDLKKSKKYSKRTNKRKPVPVAVSTGAGGTATVGYSIGFAAPEASSLQVQQQHQQQQQDFTVPHRGTVQSEVIHGEGAVSYSNTLIGKSQSQHTGSDVIQGRPIYVAPIPHPGYSRPTQSVEVLPTPQALVGDSLNHYNELASVANIQGDLHSGSSHQSLESYNHFNPPQEVSSTPESTPQFLSAQKSPKATSSVLHINDGTDFQWHDVGNGIEVSAPITPNGLQGGYRDSIPIMEDSNDDDQPEDSPMITFSSHDTPVAQALHSKPLPKPVSHFDHEYALGSSAHFDQTNAVFSNFDDGKSGGLVTGKPSFVQVSNNHLEEPVRSFPSSSFQDFMKAYSSTGRRPHSFSTGPKFPSFPSHSSSPDGESFADEETSTVGHASSSGLNADFTKLANMKNLYYLPSDKPGGEPIPAVIMPLSQLRELQASMSSSSKPQLSEPEFSSPRDIPEPPFKPSFNDQRGVISKHRPSYPPKQLTYKRPQGFGMFSHKPQGTRHGVKIMKSVPIYEEHTVNPNGNKIHGSSYSSGPWPPKETVEVQQYLMPVEQFESLIPSRSPGREPFGPSSGQSFGPPSKPGPHGHHGPRGPYGSHGPQVRRPVLRPVRGYPVPERRPQFAGSEPGAFAVTSSYRIRPVVG